MALDAARKPNVHVVVLDASGDYVAGLLPGYIPGERVTPETAAVLRLYGAQAEPGKPVLHPGLDGVAVIPCPGCRSPSDYEEAAKSYRDYLADVLGRAYQKHRCTLALNGPTEAEGSNYTYQLDAVLDCTETGAGKKRQKLYVAPRKLVISSVEEVAALDPYLSDRAREALRSITHSCKAHRAEDVLRLLDQATSNCRELINTIHRETRRNLEARLRVLRDLGVIGYLSEPHQAPLSYADLASEMRRLRLTTLVLDLGYAAHSARGSAAPESVKVLLGYQLLRTLTEAMEAGRGPDYVMLVVDEAHLFFPPSRRDYADVLRAGIERLARLGRSRGVAIVFSTHRETDVSPIIATLTNTKIYLRTDRKTAEELPLPPEYRRRLPYYRDHAAILSSYAVRGGYLSIRNAPPLIGHRTA